MGIATMNILIFQEGLISLGGMPASVLDVSGEEHL